MEISKILTEKPKGTVYVEGQVLGSISGEQGWWNSVKDDTGAIWVLSEKKLEDKVSISGKLCFSKDRWYIDIRKKTKPVIDAKKILYLVGLVFGVGLLAYGGLKHLWPPLELTIDGKLEDTWHPYAQEINTHHYKSAYATIDLTFEPFVIRKKNVLFTAVRINTTPRLCWKDVIVKVKFKEETKNTTYGRYKNLEKGALACENGSYVAEFKIPNKSKDDFHFVFNIKKEPEIVVKSRVLNIKDV